jgi:hypothetical protein
MLGYKQFAVVANCELALRGGDFRSVGIWRRWWSTRRVGPMGLAGLDCPKAPV